MTKKALATIGISAMTIAAVVTGAIRAAKRFPLDSEHAKHEASRAPSELNPEAASAAYTAKEM